MSPFNFLRRKRLKQVADPDAAHLFGPYSLHELINRGGSAEIWAATDQAGQAYALTMARYNLWQNENLVKAANELSVVERQKERGAYFGSVEKTFSHILWGDRLWLSIDSARAHIIRGDNDRVAAVAA